MPDTEPKIEAARPGVLAWAAFRPDGTICLSAISSDIYDAGWMAPTAFLPEDGWTVRRVRIIEETGNE